MFSFCKEVFLVVYIISEGIEDNHEDRKTQISEVDIPNPDTMESMDA